MAMITDDGGLFEALIKPARSSHDELEKIEAYCNANEMQRHACKEKILSEIENSLRLKMNFGYGDDESAYISGLFEAASIFINQSLVDNIDLRDYGADCEAVSKVFKRD